LDLKGFRSKDNPRYGNSGWSTSNATNYGGSWVYKPEAYGGGDGGYHVYVFKVNQEFLI